MTDRKKYIIYLWGLAIAFAPNFIHAKEELGYFYNDYIQELNQKSFTLTHGEKKFSFELNDYLLTESSLVEKEGYLSEIENPYYCLENKGNLSVCDINRPITTTAQFKKAGKVLLDDEKTKAKLSSIAKEINRDPENGKLKVNTDGKVEIFTESQPGAKMDTQKSYDTIKQAITKKTEKNAPLALSVETIKPDVFTEDVDSYGIKEKIGHGESNFAGSPKNRIHNIHTALSRFEGLLIKPGEEFSFTTLLGEVDGEHGYKEELVIKDNKTIPEFGGGICQVSTTVFRAALNSGLKITERHNHAYPVSYYAPHGSDATIYLPKPDLRFLNDTEHHILVQTKVEGYKLSIDFYGSSGGRQVEIEGPKVTEKTPDGKMKTLLIQRIKDKDGNILKENSFKSFYDNPDNYHRDQILTEKPENWSKKQWSDYKREHNIQ